MQLLATDKQHFLTLSEHRQLRSGLSQRVRKREMGQRKETGRRRADPNRHGLSQAGRLEVREANGGMDRNGQCWGRNWEQS